MSSIKSKVDEIASVIANDSIKYRTIAVDHPEFQFHLAVITIMRDRTGTNMSMYINLQGPIHKSSKELVLEHIVRDNYSSYTVGWCHTNADPFIHQLTKAILWKLKLDKLIPQV